MSAMRWQASAQLPQDASVGPVQVQDHVHAGALGPSDTPRRRDPRRRRRGEGRRRQPEVLGIAARRQFQAVCWKSGIDRLTVRRRPFEGRADVDAMEEVRLAGGGADGVAVDVVAARRDRLARHVRATGEVGGRRLAAPVVAAAPGGEDERRRRRHHRRQRVARGHRVAGGVEEVEVVDAEVERPGGRLKT